MFSVVFEQIIVSDVTNIKKTQITDSIVLVVRPYNYKIKLLGNAH